MWQRESGGRGETQEIRDQWEGSLNFLQRGGNQDSMVQWGGYGEMNLLQVSPFEAPVSIIKWQRYLSLYNILLRPLTSYRVSTWAGNLDFLSIKWGWQNLHHGIMRVEVECSGKKFSRVTSFSKCLPWSIQSSQQPCEIWQWLTSFFYLWAWRLRS